MIHPEQYCAHQKVSGAQLSAHLQKVCGAQLSTHFPECALRSTRAQISAARLGTGS